MAMTCKKASILSLFAWADLPSGSMTLSAKHANAGHEKPSPLEKNASPLKPAQKPGTPQDTAIKKVESPETDFTFTHGRLLPE